MNKQENEMYYKVDDGGDAESDNFATNFTMHTTSPSPAYPNMEELQDRFAASILDLAGEIDVSKRLLDVSVDAHMIASFYFDLISLGIDAEHALAMTLNY